jgi:hypothetical protein
MGSIVAVGGQNRIVNGTGGFSREEKGPDSPQNAIYIYTGCPRRNMPDFGRVFLVLKYTDITQNTYVHYEINGILKRKKRRVCSMFKIFSAYIC